MSLADRTITVPSIVSYYTDEQLNSEYHRKEEYQNAINNYGVIYKTVQFSDISDPEKIKQFAREWIRKNYFDGVLSFTVKAIDLHLLGFNVDKIREGDQVTVEFVDVGPTPITKTLTCLSVQYDILKPENTSYKIGIPDVSTNVKYRDSIAKKGISSTVTNDPDKDKNSIWQKMLDNAPNVILSVKQGQGGDMDLMSILPWGQS